MSSIQNVREFISERLNVAAVEISAVIERTIVRYEERTERRQEITGRPRGRFHGAENPQPHVCEEEQHWNQETSSSPDQEPIIVWSGSQCSLLDNIWKPQIKLHRIENPHVCKEEQLCDQETSSSPDQENPEAPGCKEEEEELKQESDPFVEPPAERGSEHSEELLSHNSVRRFINVRLSAAAVEIFSVFEQTMVQYEEQLDGHPRVLDPTETAHIQPHAAENPQHVCKEEQHWNQETSSSPDQENPEAPGCNEEEKELKQESDPFVEPPAGEEGDCRATEADTEDQLTAAEDNKLPVLEPIIVWSGSQCSLPENIWKPQIKLHRIDNPQQHVCKENRLHNQERTSSLCQEEPASPQIEEEQEEADDSILTSSGDESDHSEAQSEFIAWKKEQDKIHKDEKLYSCSECHKHFRWKSYLIRHKRRHKRRHTREKSFSCSDCSKSFRWKSRLIAHKRSHSGEKPFSCSECGKNFFAKGHLIQHQQTHTGDKPYSCSECGKTFSHKSGLNRHMLIHTDEKPHSCPECGKSFRWKNSLIKHKRVHTGEKPFSLSEGSKSFILKSHLIQQQRPHTGEKPYSCSECGKSFSQKGALNRHKQCHTDEKPYSCSECYRSFRQKDSLIGHRRIHTGEKPYSCSECCRRFRLKGDLIVHQRIHTHEKPH